MGATLREVAWVDKDGTEFTSHEEVRDNLEHLRSGFDHVKCVLVDGDHEVVLDNVKPGDSLTLHVTAGQYPLLVEPLCRPAYVIEEHERCTDG